MICPKCGNLEDDRINVCRKCGTPLEIYKENLRKYNQKNPVKRVAPQDDEKTVYLGNQNGGEEKTVYLGHGGGTPPVPPVPPPPVTPVSPPPVPPVPPVRSVPPVGPQGGVPAGGSGNGPEKKSRTGLIIAIIIGVIAAIALIGFAVTRGKKPASPKADQQGMLKEAESLAQAAAEKAKEAANAGSGQESGGETGQAEAPAESLSPLEQTARAILAIARPGFFTPEMMSAGTQVKAEVPDYKVEADFSNVSNIDDYYFTDEMKEKLVENGFFITEGGSYEFYENYESNRYSVMPSFVTVDSMMHTYHLYFQYLLKTTERDHLAKDLKVLSEGMLANSAAQLETLSGTEWESAARRNVAFFAVGNALLDPSADIPAEVKDTVDAELEKIYEHTAVVDSELTPGRMEDYSQYTVRGYYEGNETLERYFRAMMWYGRLNFTQKDEDLDRSALLMTLALDEETLPQWQALYQITSFFAGASDDSGYYEYRPVIENAYGSDVTVESLAGNDEAWQLYHQLTGLIEAPKINSVPVVDTDEGGKKTALNMGYRFMGQRFSVDATVFQNLIYSNVGENASGGRRMLPNGLDVPAAFGSDEALAILTEKGAVDYLGYSQNMEILRSGIANAPDEFWNASLYSRWLYTLAPILEEKGSGWPFFMQNSAWMRKDLQTYMGSYVELKHDTVLYSKQAVAEMGGGDIPVRDDRGYVEPEQAVYERLAVLTGATSDGLKSYGYLGGEDEESLARLKELAEKLAVISEKELRNETLSDEEYELIRAYGGTLEHFWKDVTRHEISGSYVATKEFPAAVITDVATDPNGAVLEIGTGHALNIYAVVPVDGQLKICSGSVFSYYEFEHPLSDRLTDSKWREMLGIQNGYHDPEKPMADWTEDIRAKYKY